MSRQPNTTATWARPNDKHWCNVCKIFVDGHPNKIRQHEAAGRHQNNMRQQMKALRRREIDQKRAQQDKEAEIRAIEQAAVAALHGDAHSGYIRSSALAAGGDYLYQPVSMVAAPSRAGPQLYRGPAEEEFQNQVPVIEDPDDPFPEHKLFSAEPPAPAYNDYVRRSDVEIDEATGMGVWECVPVHEQTQEVEEEPELEEEPVKSLPNPDMNPTTYADLDEFTEREQIAELENDYGLPAIRIQAQKARAEKREPDKVDVKPEVNGAQKVQFSFKKRRKTNNVSNNQ